MAGRGKRYGNEEEQSRKLFVGGLSFDTTDEKLQEYFSQWGKITDSVVIKEKNSTRSKGFGFVTYDTEEEADQCMGHRPHSLQGRTVDVKRAVSREESARPGAHVSVKKIFVGGLKDHHTEEEIRNFFEQHGSIDTIEMMVDKNTGKTRGFGFVTFTDYDTVDKLVAKRHYDIGGSRCEIKKALSRAEMDKAKADAEAKAMRSDYGGGRGGGGGGFGGRSQNGYDGFGRGGGGGGYGGYGDGGFGGRDAGYGSYGGEGYGGGYGYDGYGRGGGGYGGGYAPDYGSAYGSAYGSGSTHYGPMRATAQYTQRSSGPYGGGFGSGGGQGGGYAAGGYGTGANGGYNNGQGGSYGGGQGGGNYGGGRY